MSHSVGEGNIDKPKTGLGKLVPGIAITAFILVTGLALGLEEALAWSKLATLWDNDLIAYLDNGRAFLDGRFDVFINPYWPPLYGILLALVLKLSAAPLDSQLLVIRLTSFFFFVLELGSFWFLLNELKAQLSLSFSEVDETPGNDTGGTTTVSERDTRDISSFFSLLTNFLLLVCVYASLVLGQTSNGTPDLLSSFFVFVMTTLALRLRRCPSLGLAALFGVVSAFGYFCKTPVLSFGLLLLAGLLPDILKKQKLHLKHLVVAFASLIVTIAPFVCLISLKARHLTFSDNWIATQSWNIFLQYPIIHGRGPEFKHPTRIIAQDPQIYEFDNAFPGVTYPPWYAPSYWYDGVKIKINWSEYFPRVLNNVWRYLFYFAGGLILLLVACVRCAPAVFSLRTCGGLPLFLPTIFGLAFMLFGMDMFDNSNRYLTLYLVPLFGAVFLSFRRPPSGKQQQAIALFIAPFVLLMLFKMFVMAYSFAPLLMAPSSLGPGFAPVEMMIPAALERAGLKPGDKVAQLGSCRYFFAWLARLEIICDIVDVKAFWRLDEKSRAAVLELLRQRGVKALIQEPYLQQSPLLWPDDALPESNQATGWLTIDKDGKTIALPEKDKRYSTFMFKMLP